MQYVGSTFTPPPPFRTSYSRRFDKGELINQANFFSCFLEVGRHGFLNDRTLQVVNRLFGGSKAREGFRQIQSGYF